MRLSRFAILGAAVLGAIGCRDNSNNPVTPNIPDLAYIRYINAVPDTLNTSFKFIDQVQFVPLTFTNVAYRNEGLGNYQGVRLDAHKIRVFTADFSTFSTAGNTAILVDTTLTFEKGKYYTILHTGYARAGVLPHQKLQVIEDVLPTPGTSTAIRFINTGLNLGSMDFYTLATATTAITGAPAVSALAAQAISPYVTRAPSAFATVNTAVGGTTALFTGTVAPAGVAGNPAVPASLGVTALPAVDPIAGSTVAGSVITAIAFPPSVAGSLAAASTKPTVVYFLDKQPPRYSTP
jgi:hypothetical protein